MKKILIFLATILLTSSCGIYYVAEDVTYRPYPQAYYVYYYRPVPPPQYNHYHRPTPPHDNHYNPKQHDSKPHNGKQQPNRRQPNGRQTSHSQHGGRR